MKFIQIIFFVTLGFPLCCQSSDYSFPDDWIGKWSGTLNIHAGLTLAQSIEMSLEIDTTAVEGRLKYYITYGTDSNALRAYYLEEAEAEKGHYLLDEDNGIFIDMYVLGDHMVCNFEVMNTFIQTISFRQEEELHYTIYAGGFEPVRVSGDTIIGSDTIPTVQSFPLRAIQRAILTRS